jgi:hypothetical protein
MLAADRGIALSFRAAQVLWEVNDQEILTEAARKRSGKQQPPMFAPLADGDEALLLAMRSPTVRRTWGLPRAAIARTHLVRLPHDVRAAGQFRTAGASSWSIRLWPTTIAWAWHPSEGTCVNHAGDLIERLVPPLEQRR